MEDIENEIRKIEEELSSTPEGKQNEEPKEEVSSTPEQKPKRKGQSRERMMELHRIRSEKANQRRKEKEELKAKEEEVKNIRK